MNRNSHILPIHFSVYPALSINERRQGLKKNLTATMNKALVRKPKDRLPEAGKLLASIR